MTDEQLDEIEKEARAGGPEDDGGGDIAAFLVDCRILPLVKALRESNTELDKVNDQLIVSSALLTYLVEELAPLESMSWTNVRRGERLLELVKQARTHLLSLREEVGAE